MYGALAINKIKKGYVLSFVGTINSECTKVFSFCKIIPDKNVPKDILEHIFIVWAKTFFKAVKFSPSIILIYREGLSDSQLEKQIQL